MDFLRGLKSRKSKSEPDADFDAKIVFSRPRSQKVEETHKTEKSSLDAKSMPKVGNIGGAVRMDEYVVGAPRQKAKKG